MSEAIYRGVFPELVRCLQEGRDPAEAFAEMKAGQLKTLLEFLQVPGRSKYTNNALRVEKLIEVLVPKAQEDLAARAPVEPKGRKTKSRRARKVAGRKKRAAARKERARKEQAEREAQRLQEREERSRKEAERVAKEARDKKRAAGVAEKKVTIHRYKEAKLAARRAAMNAMNETGLHVKDASIAIRGRLKVYEETGNFDEPFRVTEPEILSGRLAKVAAAMTKIIEPMLKVPESREVAEKVRAVCSRVTQCCGHGQQMKEDHEEAIEHAERVAAGLERAEKQMQEMVPAVRKLVEDDSPLLSELAMIEAGKYDQSRFGIPE